MSRKDYTAKILGMEEIEVEEVYQNAREIRIRFRKRRAQTVCPSCGTMTDRVHDYHTNVLRDIPISGKVTRL